MEFPWQDINRDLPHGYGYQLGSPYGQPFDSLGINAGSGPAQPDPAGAGGMIGFCTTADMEINAAAGQLQPGRYPVVGSGADCEQILREENARTAFDSSGVSAPAPAELFNLAEVDTGTLQQALPPRAPSTATGKEILPVVENTQREPDSCLAVNETILSVASDDEKILKFLQKEIVQKNKYNLSEVNGELGQLDPEDIPINRRNHLTVRPGLLRGWSWTGHNQAKRGHWIMKAYDAVFGDYEEHEGFILPQLLGLKITREFHTVDAGTGKMAKTKWLMHEYVPIYSSTDGLHYLQVRITLNYTKNVKICYLSFCWFNC